jgi:hypothetical protein
MTVGEIVLELASKTRAKATSQQKLTPNATPSGLALLTQSSLSRNQVREIFDANEVILGNFVESRVNNLTPTKKSQSHITEKITEPER